MSSDLTAQAGTERSLLEAARRGDETAFARLVAPYRGELHAHCYQMLGSVHDAEDALQDALLRAWQGLARFEGRSSLRSWLYTIATNASLRAIERRPKRVLPFEYGPPADPDQPPTGALVESTWIDPYPNEQLGLSSGYVSPDARFERHESIELAFTALLQHLPPRQRAVLILRDVLGFSAREVAGVLETTPASIDSALQRAHAAVTERLPAQSQQASLRVLGDDAVRRLVDRFVEAWERGDVDAVVTMLTEDATIAMPPFPTWFAGRDAVATFLRAWAFAQGGRRLLVPTTANAQLAFGNYVWDAERRHYAAHAIDVLTVRGDRIADITAFLDPGAFERFGLPSTRAARPAADGD